MTAPMRPELLKTSAIAIALATGAAFVGLTMGLRQVNLLSGERWIAERLSVVESGSFRAIAKVLDEGLNDWGAPVVFVALLGLVVLRWGGRPGLWFLAAGLSTTGLKLTDVVERPRPTPDLQWGTYLPGYGGFPSGHVVYVVVLAGTLGLLAQRHEQSGLLRAMVTWFSVAISVIIGPARLITNDHWAADVAGGYLLAIFLLSCGILLSQSVGNGRTAEQSGAEQKSREEAH